MIRKLFSFCLLVMSCLSCIHSYSQTISVGVPVLEEFYRRKQLLGLVDSTLSFTQRPLNVEVFKRLDASHISSVEEASGYTLSKPMTFFKGVGMFQILPVIWQQQFNSSHPYGWNDGAMIPARGYQSLFSAGFFLKLGPLSIQLRPESVYAENADFNGFAGKHSDADLNYYFLNYNFIDAPERFGASPYKKLLWGQSSIRLNLGPASLGISNENLWWGPGVQNSIMMSNNAQGFKHFTLNTTRPVHTYIGSFEGQLIAGKLEDSGISPLLEHNNSVGRDLYIVKPNDWRYLSAINISYQPRWISGLFLGFTRSFLSYRNSLNSFSDYFPLFSPYQKTKINNGEGEGTIRDQRTSFYSRWVFQKAKAEVYFEYGLNDNSYNIRDFLGSPQHSRAYLFGFTKLVPLLKADEFIKVNAEVTQLSQSADYLVRDARSFYYHDPIAQGYTNQGEVLGAGIGSGANLQSIDIRWVKGLRQIGIAIDRYEHNMDFAREAGFLSMNGKSRRWVDLAFAANGTWEYRNLLFNAKVQGIRSLNYQWILKDFEPNKYYVPNNDIFNFHGEFGVTYRF